VEERQHPCGVVPEPGLDERRVDGLNRGPVALGEGAGIPVGDLRSRAAGWQQDQGGKEERRAARHRGVRELVLSPDVVKGEPVSRAG
jgi:hypothetical protein